MKKGLVYLITAVIMGVFYPIFSLMHGLGDGGFNPSASRLNIISWEPYYLYYFCSLTIIAPGLSIAILLNKEESKKIDDWFAKAINIGGYSRMNIFDSVMSHYTNVATVGLLITLSLFSANRFLNAVWIKVVIVVITLAIALSLYSIFFGKICYRYFSGRPKIIGSATAIESEQPMDEKIQDSEKNKTEAKEQTDRKRWGCALGTLAVDYLIIFMFAMSSPLS
ncbi:hypothetical protein MTsDn5_16230 [Alteromonas gracilis]|uniref:hypothetical protein n=1 Tax=Alteromonas gracilis TaxID=1479524 RepID=UPI0036F1E509